MVPTALFSPTPAWPATPQLFLTLAQVLFFLGNPDLGKLGSQVSSGRNGGEPRAPYKAGPGQQLPLWSGPVSKVLPQRKSAHLAEGSGYR